MLLRNVSDTLISNLFVLNLYFERSVAAGMLQLRPVMSVFIRTANQASIKPGKYYYNNKHGCTLLEPLLIYS